MVGLQFPVGWVGFLGHVPARLGCLFKFGTGYLASWGERKTFAAVPLRLLPVHNSHSCWYTISKRCLCTLVHNVEALSFATSAQ
eukprot:3627074-Rhodomonas_salina.2